MRHSEDAASSTSFTRQYKPLMALTLALLSIAVISVGNAYGEVNTIILLAVLLSGAWLLLGRASRSRALPRWTLSALIATVPIVTIYAFSSLFSWNFGAISNLAQLCLVIGFTLGLSLAQWTKSTLHPISVIFSLWLVAHALWWFMLGTPPGFRGASANPNGFGLNVLLLGYFPMVLFTTTPKTSLKRALALVAGGSCVVLLYASGSRASWVTAVIAVLIYLVWPFLSRRLISFHGLFLVMVTIAISLTWLYLEAPGSAWGEELQSFSRQHTGQNFFSGRQLIWDPLAAAIKSQPYLGHGAGSIAASFTGYQWSSHNLYLQIALQVGLVGLASLIIMFWGFWSLLWTGRLQSSVRLSAALFAAVLVHQVFEVSLVQNNLPSGFLFWMILAIGISRAREGNK